MDFSRKRIGEFVLDNSVDRGTHMEYKTVSTENSNEYITFEINLSELSIKNNREFANMRNMIELTNDISHPYLQKLVRRVYLKGLTYLIFDYSKENAFSLIESRKQILEFDAGVIFLYLVDAVKYLHSHNLVHLDIRPENILCIENEYILSNYMHLQSIDSETIIESYGTLNYQAPELYIRDSSQHPKAADIWAMGVTLLFLLTGNLPFSVQSYSSEEEKYNEYKKIISETHLEIPRYLNPNAISLLEGLLQPIPQNRISIDQIEKDQWVTSIRNELMRCKKLKTMSHISDIAKQIHKPDFISIDVHGTEAFVKQKIYEFFFQLGFKIQEISKCDLNIVNNVYRTLMIAKLIPTDQSTKIQISKLYCENENIWEKIMIGFTEKLFV